MNLNPPYISHEISWISKIKNMWKWLFTSPIFPWNDSELLFCNSVFAVYSFSIDQRVLNVKTSTNIFELFRYFLDNLKGTFKESKEKIFKNINSFSFINKMMSNWSFLLYVLPSWDLVYLFFKLTFRKCYSYTYKTNFWNKYATKDNF